jgi:hypothetical protein
MARAACVLGQGAASATPGSAAVSAGEANASDAATAQTGNPSSALGSAGAKADSGGNLEQLEAKTATAMQSAAHVHGNQAASDVPSQVNPPAAAQRRAQDAPAEQVNAAASAAAAEEVEKKRQEIEDSYTAEKKRANARFEESVAKLQKEHRELLERLDRDKEAKLAQLEAGPRA